MAKLVTKELLRRVVRLDSGVTVEWYGRRFSWDAVYVDGREVARGRGVLRGRSHFEFVIDGQPAELEILVSPLSGVSRFQLKINSAIVFDQSTEQSAAGTDQEHISTGRKQQNSGSGVFDLVVLWGPVVVLILMIIWMKM